MPEALTTYGNSTLVNAHAHFVKPLSNTVYQAAIHGPVPENRLFSLGIHPLDIPADSTAFLTELDEKLSHPACIAIGEAGLDKFSQVPIAQQLDIFRAQMQLSIRHNLPVIIHCVGRWNELELLFKEKTADSPEWIIHGFRKAKLAQKFLDLGACLSFGKALLYDEHLHELLPSVPNGRIFLETDDEELDIHLLYEQLALLQSLPLQTVADTIYANFRRVFYAEQ